MKITCTITEAEFLNAYERLWRSRKQGSKMAHYLGSGAILFGLFVYFSYPGIRLPAIFVVLLGACLALFPFLRRMLFRQAFRSNPKVQSPTEIEFRDDAISSRNDIANAELKWDFYSGAYETNEAFLLMYAKQAFSIIPKKAFPDEEKMAEFRHLVAGKLGQAVRI